MRNSFIFSLLLLFFAAGAGVAEAAPTPMAALEQYRSALSRSGLDTDAQGVYVETLDGRTLVAQNAEAPYNPASVVKLATSDVALRRLGPEFRFVTRVYANGPIDRSTGELQGDLIIAGTGDPSFTTEHAFTIADAIRREGITRVSGNLIVTGALSANYSDNRAAAGAMLKRAFDRSLWNAGVQQAFRRARPGVDSSTFRSVVVTGKVVVEPDMAVAGMKPLFTHTSAPLVKVLKTLNNHSNNWMAHSVGSRLGGAGSVERSLVDQYGFEPGNVRFQTTSGLGNNAMRPRDVVTLLREMSRSLEARGYSPANVMPVAGIDPGTLDTRLRQPGIRGSVVGKTGTLNSVSVLAGYAHTRSEGVVLFAIMNRGGSPASFRPLQDLFIRELLEACGGPAPLSYHRGNWPESLAGGILDEDAPQVAVVEQTPAPERTDVSAPDVAGIPKLGDTAVLAYILRSRTQWPEWIAQESLFEVAPRGLPLVARAELVDFTPVIEPLKLILPETEEEQKKETAKRDPFERPSRTR